MCTFIVDMPECGTIQGNTQSDPKIVCKDSLQMWVSTPRGLFWQSVFIFMHEEHVTYSRWLPGTPIGSIFFFNNVMFDMNK